jgi:ribose transport system permease protein
MERRMSRRENPDTAAQATGTQDSGPPDVIPVATTLPRTVRQRVRDVEWRSYVVYFGFIAILLFFAIAVGGRGFLTTSNLMTIVRQTTPISLMAIGMAFALSAGEIDLSVGAVVALAALVTALLLREANMAVAILGGLGIGLLVGLVNGLITVKIRIPSFLVTLGTLSIVTGLARTITGLEGVSIRNQVYNYAFGSGRLGSLSILFVWMVGFLILGHAVYRHTAFGRHVLATGGNRTAAESVGINTGRIKVAVLLVTSMTAALAGMLYAGRLHGARYTLGETDLLTVIAAVVIGGTSLFGGRGSIIGAVVGSVIMGMVNNGLILMGLDVPEQMMARGVIIILAVALSLREARE